LITPLGFLSGNIIDRQDFVAAQHRSLGILLVTPARDSQRGPAGVEIFWIDLGVWKKIRCSSVHARCLQQAIAHLSAHAIASLLLAACLQVGRSLIQSLLVILGIEPGFDVTCRHKNEGKSARAGRGLLPILLPDVPALDRA
jgi:hypothetical protein